MPTSSDPIYIPAAAITPMLTDKKGVAKAFSVSVRTVGNWLEKGTIPHLKFSDRFLRFDLAEVRAALDQHYKIQAKAKDKTGTGR